MCVVELSSVSKVYGRKRAVDHLDMTVHKGDIYGFIGRNGAGKSTTLKMICGLAAPTEGAIRLFGKTGHNDIIRKRTGMLIENAGLYPGLSARENMLLKARCLGLIDARQKTEELLAFTGLADTGNRKTKHFSMGMKQRLGIALALLGNPDLLILDEPINGLDPEGIREIRSMLVHLNEEQGMTIIISSHILGELSKIASRYGIIKDGSMIQQLPAAQLAKNCRDYLLVRVNNAKSASVLLEEHLQLSDYKIYPNGEIHIYSPCDPQLISQTFLESGISIQELYRHQQDLESYFLHLMGGEEHV
ncbi:ATP-binding cassette domain-containing protein [Faecalicatena acetigenes]|uniref:ATP-binding cassette domain-containing protein n=1 Tax=Faecalicatena acetigenes TaxID=2981790 RepID=A0ABT2TC61_9FIRM|nr:MULTISPECIES: ATP-binding cassette domain-containing protein [Lachnospiraceae]MCU6747870.1 ATP-binding cassette domain-containing protein [Faecalicatena acetigenes]SCI13926.1 Daunorubicin/doxorubicin resistance ATP-binding protein DrrA [uncultured Clostridium sp.]